MPRIITDMMLARAIELARPSAEAALAAAGLAWGPDWVYGIVRVPGLSDMRFTLGTPKTWNAEWGKAKDFRVIADQKMALADRLKVNTSFAAAEMPWLLEDGDYLYPGGVHREGLSAGISGAMGRTDESLAELVLSMLIMHANLEADRRKAEKEMLV